MKDSQPLKLHSLPLRSKARGRWVVGFETSGTKCKSTRWVRASRKAASLTQTACLVSDACALSFF